MTGFVQWLSTNPWVWLIVTLIGVSGAVSSVVFYNKSKRVREPKYLIHSNSLIRDFSTVLTNLDISYAGRKINNLTSTTLVLWNNGRETISKADVAPGDPISINIVGEGVIVNCYTVTANSPANQIQVSLVNEKQASIKFDFLDYKQGAVVQVLHTGGGSEDLVLRGTVIGAGNFALDDRYSNDDVERFTVLGRKYDISALFGVAIWGLSAGDLMLHGVHTNNRAVLDGIVMVLILFLFSVQRTAILSELPRGLGSVNMNGWKRSRRKVAELKKQ